MLLKECEIPAPWGQISARIWGDAQNIPVILFHGYLDNVGTFDRLIPLLPENFYYIGIDLPGHGLSTHWPHDIPIHTLNNLLVFKIVIDYFKREKYILLGHSYGGQMAFVFTQLYPEHVTKLIMLDTIYLLPYSVNILKKMLRYHHKTYFMLVDKLGESKTPEYTHEEAVTKLIDNRFFGGMTREAAEPLVNRMILPSGNGKVTFTYDRRLKNILNPTFDFRYMADFIKRSPVLCPVLIVMSSKSSGQVYFQRIIKLYRTYKNIKFQVVEGNHDVHNIHPDRVAPLITKFLLPKNKL